MIFFLLKNAVIGVIFASVLLVYSNLKIIMKPMRPYFRIFKDCSEFFLQVKTIHVRLQQPFEVPGVFNTPCVVY